MQDPLLSHQFAGNQQLAIPMTPSGQKACPAGDEGVDAGQVSPQMPELLTDSLPNLLPSRTLLFGNSQELTTSPAPVGSGLMAVRITHLTMQFINQLLGCLAGFVQK
ncbi:MAG: hypothetical protein ER33_08900 [Cyanobium sp. CACIAM 14]|nr:MAG: hypothetical protein ER33_08900 [Cyanobium sp. CACIAM 14]